MGPSNCIREALLPLLTCSRYYCHFEHSFPRAPSMPIDVLIVEKDRRARQTFIEMYAEMKYRAAGVDSGEQALDALEGVYFDVMVVSLRMDDPDGKTIAIRAKKLQGQLKVIVVGERRPPPELAPFVDAFVQIPFSLQDMQKSVKQVLLPSAPDF